MLKKFFEIEPASARRLRDLYNNRLYPLDDMEKTLKQIRALDTTGECCIGERFRMERGQTPKAGGLICTIKMDIFDKNGEKIKLKDEFLFTLQDTIGDLLERGCQKLNADPEEHSLYTCNWADEAVRKLKDRSATAEEEGLTEDCSLKLLHFSQGLSDEMRTYELFYSATGFPGDLKKLGKLTINENKKIDELKEQIKTFCTKENGFETPFELDHMIVRKLNKLNRPCKVLGENNKTIKRLKVNCIGLVFTILDHKVVTDPNDLRLFICERKGRFYSTYDDLVLHK
jgi:hypothetical protein